eukprot:TRINITY_DN32733_c0_g1_i1.p1 TRINITY_DN32733_c0_g1~~TRINITY_DN32733_c0_g1_i1.p1  ORF type:complete len:999 (+),score=450.61 TRINITY_DN32733_c0_g1_i1:73-3069(+)
MAHMHQFQFFDQEVVKTDDKKHNMLHDLAVLSWSSGRSQLVFGTHEGFIKLYDRSFQEQQFTAHHGPVYHLQVLKGLKYLVSLGDDGDDLRLKVWSQESEGENVLRKEYILFQSDPAPTGVRLHLNLNPAIDLDYPMNLHDGSTALRKQSDFRCPVTYLAATDDLALVALGLSDGNVLVVSGMLRDKPRHKLLVQEKKDGGDGPVTYLAWKKQAAGPKGTWQREGYRYTLLVLRDDDASAWDITEKTHERKKDNEVMLAGAAHGNVCMDAHGKISVADRSADPSIRFYGGQDVADFDMAGTQAPVPNCTYKMLGVFKDYTYVVMTADRADKDQLVIFDFPNKLRATVSHQCFFQNIVCVLAEWNSLFVLCQEQITGRKDGEPVNQKLWQIEEKDTQTKLALLFDNNHFPRAIELARNQQYDTAAVTEIHKKYGDYLYSRHEYKDAVAQYSNTIGYLEPSYVIRKFLDAQQILHLTTYLDKLHTARDPHGNSWANEDHTTLLLNCYTKLKDEAKLKDFIERERDYNPDMAILVCRQSQYYEEAVKIAEKFEKHHLFLSIQVEDLHDYDTALRYIHSLSFVDAEEQLKSYGKALVSKKPTKATELLTEICTGWKPQPYSAVAKQMPPMDEKKNEASDPHEFLKCFVDMPLYLLRFLETMKSELEKRQGAEGEDDKKDKKKAEERKVYNTLLELYLTPHLRQSKGDAAEEDEDEDAAGEDDYDGRLTKALNLLKASKDDPKYDVDHALVLVKTHDYREGILFLYETLGLYQDILQHHMEYGDKSEVIEVCQRFVKYDKAMWVQVLLYFVKLAETEDVTYEMKEVLRQIDEMNFLPPLVVIDILGRSSSTKLDVVKEYVLKRLEKEMKAIAEDQEQIRETQDLTQKYRNDIRSQQCEAQVFGLSRCSACNSALELPAVHFMCKHSYHQGCLSEIGKCQICQPTFQRTLDTHRQLEDEIENHEGFFQELSGKPRPEKFQTIAHYFGRNIFNADYPDPTGNRGL